LLALIRRVLCAKYAPGSLGNDNRGLACRPALGRPIILEWRIGLGDRAGHVPAVGLGLSFRGEPLEAPIRIGSAPPVRCQSAGRSSYSKEVRLGYLNCPFPCSSVAISTDLNCSEPNLVPAGPDCDWNSDRTRLIYFSGLGASPEMPV